MSKNYKQFYTDSNYFQSFRKLSFENPWELFNFRTTASYQLCWHTLNREMTMSEYDGNCFEDLILLYQQKDDEFSRLIYSYYRSDQSVSNFDCSLFSFCPDVCCNHTDILEKHNIIYDSKLENYFTAYINFFAFSSLSELFITETSNDVLNIFTFTLTDLKNNLIANGLIVDEKCKEDDNNPCKGFGNSACKLSFYDNKNIKDLKHNSINVTCECESGFFYSSQTDSCQDIDECELDSINHSCSRFEMSLNTYGSYVCLCPNGYKLNQSGKCEADEKTTLYDQVIKEIISINNNELEKLDENNL